MKIVRSALLAWLLLLTALALPAASTGTEKGNIRPVYPTLAEGAGYWRHARIIIDTPIGTSLHLVVGHAVLYGGPGIFCIRTSRGAKVIHELFYEASDSGTPVLEEREGSVVLKMRSGYVLIEVAKEPIQP